MLNKGDLYGDYNIDDLLVDSDFIVWCFNPEQADKELKDWISSNPEKDSLIQSAKVMVIKMHDAIDSNNHSDSISRIWNKIEITIEHREQTKNYVTLKRALVFLIFVFLIAIPSYYYFSNRFFDPVISEDSNPPWIEQVNTTGSVQKITLPDNSVVLLEPFSSLSYFSQFSSKERSVKLKGEAFFNVKRDESKPFLVYAKETITKVLGTSFRVIAYEGKSTVEVEVKSGKVAIYTSTKSNEKMSKLVDEDHADKVNPDRKIEILPNQRIVVDASKETIEKTIGRYAKPLVQAKKSTRLYYENESVVNVFDAIAKVYGIRIIYDRDKLINCMITTKLDDELLQEKLAIVCAALGLSYEEKDAEVTIKGKGCSRD